MASRCFSLHQTLALNPLTSPTPAFLRTTSFPNLKPTVRIRQLPKRAATVSTRAAYTPTPAVERLISAASYTLPFFNSIQYGRFLLMQYPKLGLLFDPLIPLLNLYRSVPYASFVAFFALYLGIVRNPSFSRYVRFNSMQAVTLDVLLVLPLLVTRILSPGRSGLGVRVTVWGHNAVFVFSCLCFVYGIVSCVLGKTPYLPFVADAAGRQLGDF